MRRKDKSIPTAAEVRDRVYVLHNNVDVLHAVVVKIASDASLLGSLPSDVKEAVLSALGDVELPTRA
jgi:hypothetical protein